MERKTSTLGRKDKLTWHPRQKLELIRPKTTFHELYRDYKKMDDLNNLKHHAFIYDLYQNCPPQKREKLQIKHITREK